MINLTTTVTLAEYKANIPDIVKTIKREYPDIIVILMSIDETGTYFPANTRSTGLLRSRWADFTARM